MLILGERPKIDQIITHCQAFSHKIHAQLINEIFQSWVSLETASGVIIVEANGILSPNFLTKSYGSNLLAVKHIQSHNSPTFEASPAHKEFL